MLAAALPSLQPLQLPSGHWPTPGPSDSKAQAAAPHLGQESQQCPAPHLGQESQQRRQHERGCLRCPHPPREPVLAQASGCSQAPQEREQGLAPAQGLGPATRPLQQRNGMAFAALGADPVGPTLCS